MKKIIKQIKINIKNYINDIKSMNSLQKLIYFGILISYLILLLQYSKIVLIVSIIAIIILLLYISYKNNAFVNQATGNGIIAGNRGKGKGLLLNKRINADRNHTHYCNVPYNEKTTVINIKEYIDSIIPNTTDNFITSSIQVVKKKDKFEGINVYWDDISVYAPNYMDSQLKKHYPSLSALLPINRHLYDAFMIITVQDFNRPYKLLRELQTDFAIKAIKTYGHFKDILWNSIPILRHFIYTKYIYYENINSAQNGLLPFKAKSVINETLKHGYLTAGQATKEQYEASNGIIRYGFIMQLKKNVKYDTRYFHQLVFNETATEAKQRLVKKLKSE